MTARKVVAFSERDRREQDALAQLVDHVFAEDDAASTHPADWIRLRGALASRSNRRPLWNRPAFIAASAAVLGLTIIAANPFRRADLGQIDHINAAPALTYLVQGQEGSNVGFVRGETDVGTPVMFSDGSRLHFKPRSVGRVLSSTPDGASVLVENGEAQFQIKHRNSTAWAIHAGPFTVHVTGTAFDLAWSANERALELSMTEGSVFVQGPLMDPGVRLVAGQTLRARADEGRVEVTANAGDGPSRAPTAAAARKDRVVVRSKRQRRVALAVAPAPLDGEVAKTTPSTAISPSWAQRVAAGDFDSVLASAKLEGIQNALAERPLGDLFALADAARYAGEGQLAKQTLLSLRARFAATGEATSAAFLLGRLHEQDDALTKAVEWFDRYLEEAPRGPYAGLALGHKMLLAEQKDQRGDVEVLARRYLKEHPEGLYAGAARDLLEGR